MADWWQADAAFFELIRDKEVLTQIVAEVAGETVATAHAGEKTKTLKRIVRDHLDGADGRTKVERWVPKWLGFPASAYTARGGVGTVAELGRGAWRERVCQYGLIRVGAEQVKKKHPIKQN